MTKTLLEKYFHNQSSQFLQLAPKIEGVVDNPRANPWQDIF